MNMILLLSIDMVINIAIHKTFSIHDSVNKLYITTMSSTKRISIFLMF